MGGVVDVIVDVFEAVVAITLTVTLIGPILALVSDDFKDWYLDALAPIMALLGITDEDVINANVVDQLLIQDNGIKNLLTKVALVHQDTQQGIIELMAQYSLRAKTSMRSFYDYGVADYYNGLPDTNIRTMVIPSAVYTAIATEYGVTVNTISATIHVPTKEEYIFWKFNKLYEYQAWDNRFTYGGLKYAIDVIDYNYGTDKYDVSVYRPAAEQTEVTITITPVDATNDNKNTHTVVTVHTIEGDIVTSDTSVNELVPKGSLVNSYTTNTTNIKYTPTVISVVAYAPKLNYVVQWYESDNGHVMYWCYEIGSGNTTLDNAAGRYVTQLEMLPIVEIRNNKVNINSNKTTEKYLDAKEILNKIGLDVDQLVDSVNQNPSISQITNAYVYFGVDASDTSSVIAKYLFNIFEFIYDQNLQDSSTHKYAAYTKEGNYNSTLIWKEQTRTIKTGIIGLKGTYTSKVSSNALILNYQATEEQYVEIQIIDVGATTFIYEGGMWATVQRTLQNGPLIIPVSRYLADSMTPLEQMELFQKSLRLSIYSAEVTHLEWYQTESFFNLIKIVIIIAAIVLAVLSAPIGGSAGEWMLWVGQAVMAMGAAYALKILLAQIDNPYLKALVAVAVIVAGSLYGGWYNLDTVITMTTDQWINIVTEFYNTKLEEIQSDMMAFEKRAEELFNILSDKVEDLAGYLDTEFITMLQKAQEVKGYVEGVDMMKYRAVGMQKDVYNTIKSQYDRIYDYNSHFRLGVV